MQNLTQPTLLLKPFAESGTRNSIPNVNSDPSNPQLADLTNGFPAITSESPDNGGLPPERADFNGLGYLTTTYDFFYQAGGTFTYNTTIATAIGGYPLGARLWYTDSNGNSTILKSTKANNTDNFITTPSYIGTSWVVETPVLDWNNTWTGNNSFSNKITGNISGHADLDAELSADNTFTGDNTFTKGLNFQNGSDTTYRGFLYKQSSGGHLVFGIRTSDNSSWQNYIRFTTDGTSEIVGTNTTAVTPTSATDNSTKIATTEWVRNHCCTTAATTTSTASKDAPAYVVTNWKSGASQWYRVWSDGWIEQGGVIGSIALNGTGTQNLHKAFTSAGYTLLLTAGNDSTSSGFDTGTQGCGVFTRKNTGSFKWRMYHFGNQYYATQMAWYACGY